MGERLAVLDFPDSPASNTDTGSGTRLTDAVEQVLDGDIPKRIDMVYSHDHYDHIGAATRFYNYARSTYADATILVWGTYSTRRVIKASKSKRAVLPNVIVRERGRTLSLGKGLNVRMIMMGGHSGQDLALYIPPHAGEPGIVLYVDVVFPRWSPFLNLALSEDVTAYEEAHLKVMKLDFDIFVGGHVRIGNKQDVRENLQFTRDLLAAAETSISSLTGLDFVAAGVGKTGDPSAPEFGNVWFATIDVVRRLQIAGCYRIILEKWGCRLAGLDITGSSHCFTAVSHVILAA